MRQCIRIERVRFSASEQRVCVCVSVQERKREGKTRRIFNRNGNKSVVMTAGHCATTRNTSRLLQYSTLSLSLFSLYVHTLTHTLSLSPYLALFSSHKNITNSSSFSQSGSLSPHEMHSYTHYLFFSLFSQSLTATFR